MTKQKRQFIGPIAAILLISLSMSGCGTSPPTQFITLSPDRSKPLTSQKQSGKPVKVGKIDLSPELDRLPLVSLTDSGAVKVDGTVRWAAPLDQTLRQTLAIDLAIRLGRKHVVMPGQPEPAGGVRTVVMTVERFAPGAGEQVYLFADWSLVTGNSHRVLIKRHASIHTKAKSKSSADIAEAMSKAVAKLSDQIAKAVADNG